jgi:hypothetical protein
VKIDVVPIDLCGVVFGIPYMYMRDIIFMRRSNKYPLVEDGNFFSLDVNKV